MSNSTPRNEPDTEPQKPGNSASVIGSYRIIEAIGKGGMGRREFLTWLGSFVGGVAGIKSGLIKFGKLIRPGMGVSLLPDSITMRWGIQGLAIAKVEPGSPAEQAGLQSARKTRLGHIHLGDIITKIDNKPVRIFDDLAKILDRHN